MNPKHCLSGPKGACFSPECGCKEPYTIELTLRDKMAAACLPAIYESMTQLTDRAAELAYEQADEMLKARNV